MRLGLGLGVSAHIYARPPVVPPTYLDPDLNTALAFKQRVLSYDQGSGDRAAQLFASFPALKSYLGVGHKGHAVTPGSTHPAWDAANSRLNLSTSNNTVVGYDVQGWAYVAPSVAADVIIRDSYIRGPAAGGYSIIKVQKDNSDDLHTVTIEDSTLEKGQANDPNRFSFKRVLAIDSPNDSFKGGSTGGASRPTRIELSWGEACGRGAGSHGDGIQISTTGDLRMVASGLYSAMPGTPYSTAADGLANAVRIDCATAGAVVERVHVLGCLLAWGGGVAMFVSAQQPNSTTRNVTIAHCVVAPLAFRVTPSIVHPALTDAAAYAFGVIENVGFIGNVAFGEGPVTFADRGAPAADVTGIWGWNKATLDTGTAALWKELGLLDAGGDPMPGMLRSVAGTIGTQGKALPTTGAVPLNLDLSAIPADAVITLHLGNVSGLYELEYDAGGTVTSQPKTVATTGAAPLGLDLTAVPENTPISVSVPNATGLYDLEYLA